jgi:hypothetical protein
MSLTGEGHIIKPTDRKRCDCSVNGCRAPGYWMSYSRFRGPDGDSIAFYPVCREHAPSVFHFKLGKREILIAAATLGDARDAALRTWFGPGVYWDSHELDGPRVGRVVRQKIRRSHGKDRFVDEPLTKWVRVSVRKS